ncbi:MAG: hypothetical protein AB1461_17690 [Thermodesulfobacteriota bacterium]
MVGITNPDPTLTRHDADDPARSSLAANPFTYFERYCKVRDAMADEGLREEISIEPFPVDFPELYHYYLPMQATFFLSIYDEWGRRNCGCSRIWGWPWRSCGAGRVPAKVFPRRQSGGRW